RPEVDAVMLEAFLVPIDEDGVALHGTGGERLRLLVDGDESRVDRLRGGQPILPEEDGEELLEGHLVDVLIQRYVRLDRARFVLDLAAADFDRDAELLERLVDLLVDVGLLLRRVLGPVPGLVEIAAGGSRVERRMDRILPVRGVRVPVRILRIALRRAEAAVSLPARPHRPGPPLRYRVEELKVRCNPSAMPLRPKATGKPAKS